MLNRYVRVLTAVLVLMLLAPVVAAAATFPPYGNTLRYWGAVVDIQPTVEDGQPWIAFTIETQLGVKVRLDCGTAAVALGCDLVDYGDSVLVVAHSDDRLSCHADGIDNYAIPNVLWLCNGFTVGTCEQLTP